MFSLKNNIDKKGCNIMNIKLKVIKIQIELLRSILHFVLNFKKTTDKIVISCSQKLDEVIVKYYKVKGTSGKVAISCNREVLNNTLSSFLKTRFNKKNGLLTRR